jgi:hypothetical protein
MTMPPGLRKLAHTMHVTTSVGWLGAVAALLALAIAGLTGDDSRLVATAYPAMRLTTWIVIVPLSFFAPNADPAGRRRRSCRGRAHRRHALSI